MKQTEKQTDTPEKVLDAALECVQNFGLTRTTLTDVAKAAGLSRMTIYRHYASVGEILQDLMTREFNDVVLGAVTLGDESGGQISRADVVDSAVGALDALTQNSLFERILRTDPELLLTYVTTRPGRFQLYAEGVLATGITAAQAAGEVRQDDPARLAASMLLAMRGFALTDKSQWSKKQRQANLDDLKVMFDGLLAPESPASHSR